MLEQQFEKVLNIDTDGYQYGYPKDAMYHRYEPTPYYALEQLFINYEMPRNSKFIDFGCGKGRVPIYVHWKHKIQAVGIEMDRKFYIEAVNNFENYMKVHSCKTEDVTFIETIAESYKIAEDENIFFFFNPFSVHVFRKVVNNIFDSYNISPREIDIVLYYPSPEYIHLLENETSFELFIEKRLECFKNQNERLVVYRLKSL